MNPRTSFLLTIAFGLFFVSIANAKIIPNNLFTNGVVLQRNAKSAFWGTAEANQKLSITTSWNGKVYQTQADAKGNWKVFLETGQAGGPFEIMLKANAETVKISDVLLGEVWICSGQSNMDMPVKGFTNQPVQYSAETLDNADEPKIRLFQVKRRVSSHPLNVVEGKWEMANFESVSNFSAVGYLFAKRLYQKLNIPIGIIQSAWGGTMIQSWMATDILKKYSNASDYSYDHQKNKPSSLFNGMIQPLIGYTIKGIIWYQGESNRGRADEYLQLFPEMVKDWCQRWGLGDFPFYYVQIAPYNYIKDGRDNLWKVPYMRDIQYQCLSKMSNSEMVVTLDVGHETVIHPPDKETVAKRLANIALAKLYDIKTIHAFPFYKSYQIKGDRIELSFSNAENGLTANYQSITQFEIAGEDQVFYKAKARITPQGIELSTPQVKQPLAARYAYKDYVNAEVFNTEGLPLTSFRTDNWPLK